MSPPYERETSPPSPAPIEPNRSPEAPPADRVLSYCRPPASSPAREPEGLLGCLSTALLIPICIIGIALVAYATRLPGWLSLLLIATLFIAPMAIGLALRKSQRWNALGVGLLFGLAIAALIVAICIVGTR